MPFRLAENGVRWTRARSMRHRQRHSQHGARGPTEQALRSTMCADRRVRSARPRGRAACYLMLLRFDPVSAAARHVRRAMRLRPRSACTRPSAENHGSDGGVERHPSEQMAHEPAE
eukprot:3596976-Prymnesium_polylepis.1